MVKGRYQCDTYPLPFCFLIFYPLTVSTACKTEANVCFLFSNHSLDAVLNKIFLVELALCPFL